MVFFTAHGGRGNEGTVQIDGMNVGSAFNGGGVASSATTRERRRNPGDGRPAASAKSIAAARPSTWFPRRAATSSAAAPSSSTAGEWSQGDNLDDELSQLRLRRGARADQELGLPASRWAARSCSDRLWFYGQLRTFGSHTDVARQYGNENAGDPNAWSYVEDRSLKVRNANDKKIGAIRLTDQLTPRNKFGFYYDYQHNCTGSSYEKGGEQCRDRGDDWIALNGGFNSGSPESGNVWDDREKIVQGQLELAAHQQAAARSRRVVVQQPVGRPGAGGRADGLHPGRRAGAASRARGMPLPFYAYRAPWSFFGNICTGIDQQHNVWRASALVRHRRAQPQGRLSGRLTRSRSRHRLLGGRPGIQNYLFFDGFPISLTQRIIAPAMQSNRDALSTRFYVQDQWTKKRVTLQGALRYEHALELVPRGRERHHWRRRATTLPRSCSRSYESA